jgi:hypothetical protein
MVSKVKGIILSIEDTLLPLGRVAGDVFLEVTKLIKFLKAKNIEFVVFTNRKWRMGERLLEDVLKEHWGDFAYLCRADDPTIPGKPQAAATQYVLNKMGWDATETLYIGASENDMRTAVNGNLLFLRAAWYANKTDYGFEFSTPKDIARFINTFCLRDHLWCFQVEDGKFSYYALAPFSTMKPEYTLYSEDARAAAKFGKGHPDFWVGALVSSLYFSGIHQKIDYIAVYPGHKQGSGNAIMNDAMSIFGKCFRKAFLPDLIVRHTTSTKSQTARNSGIPIDHINQLNTIYLNPNPTKGEGKRYAASPVKRGKTVLVIDDICTRGYSLEAARAYIEQTGADVITASWLKTINTNIEILVALPKFNPFTPNTFKHVAIAKSLNYHANFVSHLVPSELARRFNEYEHWDWPAQ